MKKLYLYLALTLPLWSIVSCTNSNIGHNESSANDSAVTADSSSVSDSTKSVSKGSNSSEALMGTQSQLEFMKSSSNWGKYQTGVLPQMAHDAPEYCGKILKSGKKHFLIVDKGKMNLFLYDQFGNIIKKYPIACAKNYGNKAKKGDSRTNEGYFPAEGVYDSREWHFTNDAGYTSPAKGVYGPWFIRLVHPIGIHGTSSPGSIGKRCSHGCIRVNNEHIKEIIQYVDKGTPIIVSPGPKDMQVNAREGRPTLAVVTEPGTPKATPGNFSIAEPMASTSTDTKKKDNNDSSVKDKSSSSDLESDTNTSKENMGSSHSETEETKEAVKATESPRNEEKSVELKGTAEPSKPASTKSEFSE